MGSLTAEMEWNKAESDLTVFGQSVCHRAIHCSLEVFGLIREIARMCTLERGDPTSFCYYFHGFEVAEGEFI